MSLNEKLILLRKEKGYSALKCCKEMGLTASTLQAIENGTSLPGSKLLITLCKYFNVSSDWLLGLKEERN